MRPFLLVLLALAGSGCTTTRALVLDPEPDPEVVAYLGGLGDHVGGWVVAGADTLRASRVRIEGRELSFDAFPRGERVRYPLAEVESIDLHDPRKSLLFSMLGAAAAAAGVGAVAALVADPSAPSDRSRTEAGLRAAAITGVFTVPIGFVLGVGGAGHRVRIQVEPRLRR